MSQVDQKTKKSSSKSSDFKQLEEVISRAVKKVGGRKENDLCKYIPVKDGYIHHFTMRKMKHEKPTNLKSMIEKYIINISKPSKVPPKKRAPRGSRKRPEQISLNRTELENLINLVKDAGDVSLVSKLTPRRSLAVCRKELIRSIKNSEVRADLWNMYSETVNTIKAISSDEATVRDPSFIFSTSAK